MSQTLVTLDGFVFQDFEVPETMPWGGRIMGEMKRYPGGKRRFDAMGFDPRPKEWSGRFRGLEAKDRARQLEEKLKAQKAVSLTWDEFSYTVIITEFAPDYAQGWEIPYRIVCEVLTDDAAPNEGGETVGVDEAIASDVGVAQGLAGQVGDALLTGHFLSLDSVLAGAGNLARATTDTIGRVLEPVAAIQGRVNALLGAADGVLLSATAIGGIVPGIGAAAGAMALRDQIGAMIDSTHLYDIQSYMGRVQTNLEAIGSSGAEVVTAGGDLYTLASRAYGDAAEWATIARANKMSDPVIDGLQTILVPPRSLQTGGVLDQ